MRAVRTVKGFTLLELVVVMVVVAILSALAFSNYRHYIRKSRRSSAIQTLLAMQQAEERYRSNNTTYGDLTAVWGGVAATEDNLYGLAITNLGATTYTLAATAQGVQVGDKEGGTSCTTLSIVVNGGNESKTPAACWS